ncbi:mas-related G-protein coupled receptor member H-like [Lacerta agilis]|uniref:mas-related G-protein coupled receptor member H-like n=1 Tax=Lacerta agilis TaxID=80427 RepID=UPI0014193B41|nr:mas-related G-protein coupled receptor member H-like [Lacerta agilis]
MEGNAIPLLNNISVEYVTDIWYWHERIIQVESYINDINQPDGQAITEAYSGSGDIPDYLNSNESILFRNFNNSTTAASSIVFAEFVASKDLVFSKLAKYLINSFVAIICILGLLGNGYVIWLLGFQFKRNLFTTYVLNLSIADFAVLLSLISTAAFASALHVTSESHILNSVFLFFFELFCFTYSTSQYLLAAISIDRCVVVLFPLWHRLDRGPNSSAIICAVIWILSFLLSAIHFALRMTGRFGASLLHYQLLVNALLCTPLMFISSLILLIKVCCKAQQCQQGKLIMAILLALLFFLIFAFPLNAVYVIYCYYFPHLHSLMLIGFGCSSVNSSINPIIYFLVGRRGQKGPSRVSMRAAISRVFKDVGDCTEDKKSRTESKVMI